MMAIPVTTPKLVTAGDVHSLRWRTMRWKGMAISSSSTLPRRSQETSLLNKCDKSRMN